MKGVVAAGDPLTAEAAARILREGGNAVDAAIAGALAAFVAEPLLASAGGAGMLTAALPGEEPAVVDFFSQAPLALPPRDALDFDAVEVDFGSATQVFHVGRGSAAAPVALPGLAEAARRFGTKSLAELIAPAVKLAREGATLTRESADVFSLLWPINARDPETVAVYTDTNLPPTPRSRHPNPALADVLEAFAAHGDTPPEVRERMLEAFGHAAGGCLTEADLAAAVPVVGPPRALRIGPWEVLTSPRIGGRMVDVIVSALAGAAEAPNPEDEVLRFAEACRRADRAKRDPRSLGSTTHISVADGSRGAA